MWATQVAPTRWCLPTRWLLVVVFCAAFGLRLVAVLTVGHASLERSSDAQAFYEIAINLVERHQFANTSDPPHRLDVPQVSRAPLLPFVLAGAYAISGRDLLVGQLVLALVGSCATIVVYLLGSKLFGSLVGLVAAVLVAIYPFFLFLASIPLTESIGLLLYPILALLVVQAATDPKPRYMVLTGIALGLSCLNSPRALPLLPFLLCFFLLVYGYKVKLALSASLILVGTTAIVLLPWTLRNWMLFHAFIPVNTYAWGNCHAGNNPYTDRSLALLEEGKAFGWIIHGQELEGIQSPVEAERKYRDLALSFIREHPAQVLQYDLRKLRLFFAAYPYLLHRLSWYPLSILALIGVILSRKEWRRLLPLYLLIVPTVLIPTLCTALPRYRAPIEPLFMILAAYAIVKIAQALVHFHPISIPTLGRG